MMMNLNKFIFLKSPYILILVGPPLVGKSFFCKKFIKEIDPNIIIISRDQIVLDVYGSDNYDESFGNVDQKRVNSILEKTILDAADNKEDVIIDMTNLTSKRRRHTLSHFSDEYTKIAVLFPPVEWDELKRRNERRK